MSDIPRGEVGYNPESRQSGVDNFVDGLNRRLRLTKEMLASLALAVGLFSACAPAQVQVRDEIGESGNPDDATEVKPKDSKLREAKERDEVREKLEESIRWFENDIRRLDKNFPAFELSQTRPFDKRVNGATGFGYDAGQRIFILTLQGLNDESDTKIEVVNWEKACPKEFALGEKPYSIVACESVRVKLPTGEVLEEPCDGKFRNWAAFQYVVNDLAGLAEARHRLKIHLDGKVGK